MGDPTPTECRKFTDDEDIMLLRQVNAERPFEARQGEITKAGTSVARALNEHADFRRPGFDYKKAQHRFGILIESHRSFNRDSSKASDINEAYGGKLQLLDALLSAVDDTNSDERDRLVQTVVDSQRSELEGSIIREEALSTLSKRKSSENDKDGGSSNTSRFAKLAAAIQEDTKADLEFREAELEFRKYQYERDIEEREKDSEAARGQARLQHEDLTAMLNILQKKYDK
ncbi:hypothetical protein AeMF1_018681 [Aphanomyces euteiches]|nr:hypothetical protein AeMF1_018681 [Aphanomyces euteiches]KAH9184098.1 hypothetical protein AeNC1_013925 [Aphanomyces euteiches]